MNRILAAFAGVLAFILLQVPVQAAEIAVGSSDALTTMLAALGPKFEKASGDKLDLTFETSNLIKGQIDGGKAFDVVILTPAAIDDLSKNGKIVPGSVANIAHTGIGLAVKKGAPRPHITNADSLKTALLNAKTIAYTTTGQSGIAFSKLIGQLGIADQVTAKAKTFPSGRTAQLVVDGQADMAIQLIPELKAVKGVTVVPFPDALQTYVVLTAAITTTAQDPKAAAAFIRYIQFSPAALPVMKAKGLAPGGV
jgi:molybdate transport system substrate-binding protein